MLSLRETAQIMLQTLDHDELPCPQCGATWQIENEGDDVQEMPHTESCEYLVAAEHHGWMAVKLEAARERVRRGDNVRRIGGGEELN